MERCSVKTMDSIMRSVLDTSISPYLVAKSHHEAWHNGKWCVWYEDRLFLCACDAKKEANKIADALNTL